MSQVDVVLDEGLLAEVAARFKLRKPNRDGLAAVVTALEDANGTFRECIADLATGVGKTYLMAGLVDYLAAQGTRNILVVTPGSTIQRKTVENFTPGSKRHISGAEWTPVIVTPENFRTPGIAAALRDESVLKVFVFNVQQLISPTAINTRRVHEDNENLGAALYALLQSREDLVVIADEHHLYHEKAKAFSAAVRDLEPVALVGLTATPAAGDVDKIVYEYALADAIADGLVKTPVLVYRQDGMKDERTQLGDACHLLRRKEEAYVAYRQVNPTAAPVKPMLFVVCESIQHAQETAQILASDGFIGEASAVLEVHSNVSDDAMAALDEVEDPASPIRAIVSVNMLGVGWDVKNISVIAARRTLASEMLTEQVLGRGLRLPFGIRTGVDEVDQVDLVAHESYERLLASKDVLNRRLMPTKSDTPLPVFLPGTASKSPDDVPKVNIAITSRESLDDFDDGSLFQISQIEPKESGGADSAPESGFNVQTREFEERTSTPVAAPQGRVEGAPTLVFPRPFAHVTQAKFSLSSVADEDARAAGAKYKNELPVYLNRVALEARRDSSGGTSVEAAPLAAVEAEQKKLPLDTVQGMLLATVETFMEVEKGRRERNAAARITAKFLEGAGVADAPTAAWSERRQRFAAEGLRAVIAAAAANVSTIVETRFQPVELPVEPVLVDPASPGAYDGTIFVKQLAYRGWKKHIMPVAKFDAKSTEWAIAHTLDSDPAIKWWLRLQSEAGVYLTTKSGKYYPDFVAIAEDETRWLIEGKSDKEAKTPEVQEKKLAAEDWARIVRDEDDEQYGQWRYLFATESNIGNAQGTWAGLVAVSDSE